MSGYDGRGGKFDIIAVRGADLAFTVTATDSSSAAIDLSAATIAGELYNADGTVVDTMTDVVSGTGDNIITLSFTDAETALLTGSSYPWTLWVTRGGDKRPWLAGRVRVVDSSNGVRSTDGDAITLTVDSDVNVSISVLAIGGSGGGAESLDELTDVTITTPISGNVLGYNGSVWVNTTPAGGGDMLAANNLSDLANKTTARDNLGVEIGVDVQAYSAVLANTTASYTTAEASKLSGIEAAADVTDTTNVTAAGALMDSEVDADIKTLSLPANTTISAFGATLVDDADQATARTTLGLGTAATATIADYLPKVAAGASVENIGAVESNVQTVAATGATETLDTAVYGVFDCTMDQACEFTFSNPAPSGKATTFVLILRGAFTPTLPSSIDWSGGAAPTYTTPSVYVFTTVDGGTTWLGAQTGKAFA